MSQLFPIDLGPEPDEKVSYTRRLTLRNKARLAQRLHPTGLGPTSTEGTCGTCVHHRVHSGARDYHKCEFTATSGPATDIRTSWPACPRYLPTPFGRGSWPDAYRSEV